MSDVNADATSHRTGQPVELGQVDWGRDFGEALRRAGREDKPVLVLFDEVPGCHTCISYGEIVLSHPLVVEAAEALFVPVAVFNNVEGEDRRVLESFGEPTWNNPVVRIIDADRTMLAPRVNGDYTVAGLTRAMVTALHAMGEAPPRYLELLEREAEHERADLERAVFAMHCFWEGQAKLGTLDGVLATHVGFLDGHEVVEVAFDPATISYAHLLSEARRLKCASAVYTRSDAQHEAARSAVGSEARRTDEPVRRSDKDELYRVRTSTYAYLPLTRLQAAMINAAIGEGDDPDVFLSPRQKDLLDEIRAHPEEGWPQLTGRTDLATAWSEVDKVIDRAGK